MTAHAIVPQSVTMNVAGFGVTLETSDSQMADRLRQRYRLFLVEKHPALFTITLETMEHALFVQPTPGSWLIEAEGDGEQLRYLSYQEQGEVDLSTGTGWLKMDREGYVENFLRVLYAWICLENRALLLHAAGAIRNGAGYAFFGHSGAGKTTVTRLSEESSTILSDDLVIIRCHEDGCTLHGVPFRGEYGDAPRANQQAPLQGLFRLHQSKKHALKPLPTAVAVAELAASAPFVTGKPSLSGRLFDVCQEIAGKTPVQALYFSKDNGFWNKIDGHNRAIPQTAFADSRAGY